MKKPRPRPVPLCLAMIMPLAALSLICWTTLRYPTEPDFQFHRQPVPAKVSHAAVPDATDHTDRAEAPLALRQTSRSSRSGY